MAVEDSVAQDQIRAFVERIERLEEEKAALASDIREIYAEAKGNGFDTKILRRVVGIRKQDANARMEQEALLELYMGALGMIEAPPSYDEERDRLNSLASKIEADLRKPKAEPTPDPIAALKTNPDLHIVSASEIKPKSEPQPLTQAGSDLTTPQALNGQVATNPVAKADADVNAGGVDSPSVSREARPGKTAEAESVSRGGSARTLPATSEVMDATAGETAPKYAAPGVVTWETYPPEGVTRSAVSIAFANIGQDAGLIKDELAHGKAQPIVKIGRQILDGWGRFMTARDMTEMDGKPLSYAVVQYAGTDPLIDAIKLNVEGRVLDEGQKRKIAATLVRQNPSRKDDIYRAFELWMEPV